MSDNPDQEPVPAAEWVARDTLHGWPRNPRKNDAAVPVVADSIRRFGFGSPMVARREDKTILAGHTRAAACDLLAERWGKASSRERQTWHPDAIRVAAQAEVVVRFVDLDEHDSQLFALADNKTAERSAWDDELLAAVVADLDAAGLDLLDGTGFDEADIKRILGEEDAEAAGATGTDPGEGRYKEQFGCIVICANEVEQERVYGELKAAGYSVRVVTT